MFADLHNVLVREHGGALGGGEAEVGEAHGGRQAEGNGKPAEAASDEAPDSLSGEESGCDAEIQNTRIYSYTVVSN